MDYELVAILIVPVFLGALFLAGRKAERERAAYLERQVRGLERIAAGLERVSKRRNDDAEGPK